MAVATQGVSSLNPTFEKDTLGSFFVISCGKVTGQFYSDKFSQKKGSNKCILISGKWYYTLSEVETLAGEKTRKWRQTLFHLDKPLSAYDLSAPSSTSFGVSGLPVHSLNPTTQQDDNDQHGRSTSAQPITPLQGTVPLTQF